MGVRRKFTAEYKREAVAMLEVPGVTVSQIATDLGIGANVLGRWRREVRQWRSSLTFILDQIGPGRSVWVTQ